VHREMFADARKLQSLLATDVYAGKREAQVLKSLRVLVVFLKPTSKHRRLRRRPRGFFAHQVSGPAMSPWLQNHATATGIAASPALPFLLSRPESRILTLHAALVMLPCCCRESIALSPTIRRRWLMRLSTIPRAATRDTPTAA